MGAAQAAAAAETDFGTSVRPALEAGLASVGTETVPQAPSR